MKILKCSEPACNTHKGFDNLPDGVGLYRVDKPIPESWACNWHTDPPRDVADPATAIRRHRDQLAVSAPPAS